jgi:hypothetical protein
VEAAIKDGCSFARSLRNFVGRRCEEVERRLYEDQEYRILVEEAARLYQAYIKPRVPFDEYNKYESVLALQELKLEEEVYLQGLRDGLALAGILKGDRTLLFHEGTPGSEKLCREDAGTAKVVF